MRAELGTNCQKILHSPIDMCSSVTLRTAFVNLIAIVVCNAIYSLFGQNLCPSISIVFGMKWMFLGFKGIPIFWSSVSICLMSPVRSPVSWSISIHPQNILMLLPILSKLILRPWLAWMYLVHSSFRTAFVWIDITRDRMWSRLCICLCHGSTLASTRSWSGMRRTL